MAAASKKLVALVNQAPKLANAAREFAEPRLRLFWKYAKVEMKPPSPREWPEIIKGFENLVSAAKTQKWKQSTVKEGLITLIVGAEIAFWFFAGEVIGKGSLIGYNIVGATHW